MAENTEQTYHQRTDKRQYTSYNRLTQTFREVYGQGIRTSGK